jgi:hypothetical protein
LNTIKPFQNFSDANRSVRHVNLPSGCSVSCGRIDTDADAGFLMVPLLTAHVTAAAGEANAEGRDCNTLIIPDRAGNAAVCQMRRDLMPMHTCALYDVEHNETGK